MNETQNEEQLRFPDDIMEEGAILPGASRRFSSSRAKQCA